MKSIIDLHTHALASGHAYSTVKENIEFAPQELVNIANNNGGQDNITVVVIKNI